MAYRCWVATLIPSPINTVPILFPCQRPIQDRCFTMRPRGLSAVHGSDVGIDAGIRRCCTRVPMKPDRHVRPHYGHVRRSRPSCSCRFCGRTRSRKEAMRLAGSLRCPIRASAVRSRQSTRIQSVVGRSETSLESSAYRARPLRACNYG